MNDFRFSGFGHRLTNARRRLVPRLLQHENRRRAALKLPKMEKPRRSRASTSPPLSSDSEDDLSQTSAANFRKQESGRLSQLSTCVPPERRIPLVDSFHGKQQYRTIDVTEDTFKKLPPMLTFPATSTLSRRKTRPAELILGREPTVRQSSIIDITSRRRTSTHFARRGPFEFDQRYSRISLVPVQFIPQPPPLCPIR